MSDKDMSEGEYIGYQYDDADFEDDDAPMTENQKMLAFHGYESGEDLSHISGNEFSRMWWTYRNRKKLGL